MPWAAVRAIARSDLRRGWRTLVVLAVLAGLAGGVVLASVAMARRTATAHDRLLATTHLDDARIFLAGPPGLGDRIKALDVVEQSWDAAAVIGQVEGEELNYLSVSVGADRPADLLQPVVIEGRAPDPRRVDEILVAEELAAFGGYEPGDVIRYDLLLPEEVFQFDTGFGEPDGPTVELRVVGIGRLSSWGNGVGPALGTPAFAERYPELVAGSTLVLRLDGRPDAERRLSRALDEIAASLPAPPGGGELGPLRAFFPRSTDAPQIRTAERVLVGGLVVFVGIAVLAGLLAVAQGLGRHHAAATGDQQVEAALGLTVGERTAARVLAAAPAALLAAALAAAGATAAAGLEPLGELRRFEPAPGWAPNVAVIALGALGVAVAFLLLASATARRTARHAVEPAGRGTVAAGVPALLRPAWLMAGVAFAVRRGGRGGVPVGATLAGAVLGVTGVVAATTFGQSLQRLEHSPARYGWSADFSVVDAKEADIAAWVRDDRVGDLDVVGDGAVRHRSQFVRGYSYEHRKGALPWTLLEGRLPRTADEVAVGPAIADRSAVGVGQSIRLGQQRLTVVGVVVTPTLGRERLGDNVLMTSEGLASTSTTPPLVSAFIRAADPTRAAALADDYAQRLEITRAEPPTNVRTLIELGRLPTLLAALLGAVGAVALAHALVLTTRRRARDLAVLRTIGLTPGQTGGTVASMALTTALVGLALGTPLGLGVGRLVWYEVARSTGVAGDPLVPGTLLLALVPAALVGAVLVALVPAWRAARLRPAVVLQTE